MRDVAVMRDTIIAGLNDLGFAVDQQHGLYIATALGTLFLLSVLVLYLTRFILNDAVSSLVKRSRNEWDDELQKHRFFRRCAHVVPAIFIYMASSWLLTADSLFHTAAQKFAIVYLLIALMRAASALFNTIEDVYNASEMAKRAPITGFIQVGKLLTVIVVSLLIIATIIDKSPLILLSGLGAVTAIVLLLFRDTILGFVAGIQIAANRMVNTGDWIEMSKYGADGNVLEVGLTTVKVQNWDNTISTIPTYTLIADSVKNWRGMTQSGGRRIKRSILIDIQSVQFCDAEMLENYKKIRFIKAYIDEKLNALREFHQHEAIDESDLINARRLTNLGTFRAYIEKYLRANRMINQDMTLMVRQLPPTEHGIPLEIYCFSAEKAWVEYEKIQADIFDHLLAMLRVFELRAYQRVSDRMQDTPNA